MSSPKGGINVKNVAMRTHEMIGKKIASFEIPSPVASDLRARKNPRRIKHRTNTKYTVCK